MSALARRLCAAVMREREPPGPRSIGCNFSFMQSSVLARFRSFAALPKAVPAPSRRRVPALVRWPASGQVGPKWLVDILSTSCGVMAVLPQPVISLSDGHSLVLVH